MTSSGRRPLLAALVLGLVCGPVLWTPGCAGPRRAGAKPDASPLVPPLRVSVDHFQGSPLSGPRLGVFAAYPAEASEASPDASLALRAEVWLVQDLEHELLGLVSSAARIIAMPLDGEPLRPSIASVGRGRVGLLPRDDDPIASAGRARALGAAVGALDVGMTSVLRLERRDRPGESLELHVHRPLVGAALDALLAVRHHAPWGSNQVWEQVGLPLGPVIGAERLVLVLPTGEESQLALIVWVDNPRLGSAEHAERVVAARAQADAHHQSLLAALDVTRIGVPPDAGMHAALAGMAAGGDRRGVLLYLANLVQVPVCADVALSERTDLLDELASAVGVALAPGAAVSSEQLAWLLETECLDMLVRHLEDATDDPLLEALLLRHTGEVGRHQALLDELLGSVRTPAELDRRLVEENLLFLDDNAPSARVRAFDWLLSHGGAPEGYDPLGTRADRRAALNRHRESQVGGGRAP